MGDIVVKLDGGSPDAKISESASSTPSVRGYQAYILTLLLIPFTFLVSSIVIVRSASFPVDSADPFLLNLDHAFDLKHADCGVVIFGDSTALTGIDPITIERYTGLKTCNIAQTRSTLEILGLFALDEYLKKNASPKYLVMQFSPETFAHDGKNFFWPEGLTLLLRKKSVLEALPVLLAHPVESYNFAIWAIKAKVRTAFHTPPDFAAMEAIFQSHNGLLILPKPPQTGCSNDPPYGPPNISWVRMLRERYALNNTRVLINVSPLPACAPNAARIAAATSNVTDNSLTQLPVGLFCDLDRHLTLEGAELSSSSIGRQILSLQKR
jgi:hypothetical protein